MGTSARAALRKSLDKNHLQLYEIKLQPGKSWRALNRYVETIDPETFQAMGE